MASQNLEGRADRLPQNPPTEAKQDLPLQVLNSCPEPLTLGTRPLTQGSPACSMAGVEGHGGSEKAWAPHFTGRKQAQSFHSCSVDGMFRQAP